MSEVEENPISSPKKDKSNKSNLLLIFLLMLSFSCIAYFVYEGTKLDDSIQKLKANEKKMKQENSIIQLNFLFVPNFVSPSKREETHIIGYLVMIQREYYMTF